MDVGLRYPFIHAWKLEDRQLTHKVVSIKKRKRGVDEAKHSKTGT